MIKRLQFAAYLNEEYREREIDAAVIAQDRAELAARQARGELLTVALFRYRHMLFLYIEAAVDITPEELLPSVSLLLSTEPQDDGFVKWRSAVNLYHTFRPSSAAELKRGEAKRCVGRLAYLHRDKIPSYIYYHKAIMDEGLYEGDKYLYISLIDRMLFAYSEEPKIPWHIRIDDSRESAVIGEWAQQSPRDHFDRSVTGDSNFMQLDTLIALAAE